MTKIKWRIAQIVTIAAALGLAVQPNDARATEGYFNTGYGAIQKSLAGAGVADSEDATALAINPAGLVDVGQQFNGSITSFMPTREYTASGTQFIAPGTVQSGHGLFPIPTFAYSQQIDGESAFGVAAYGNGGLDTSYNVFNRNTLTNGVFGTGITGVDLNQAFLSAGYARRFGPISVGIAPILVVQRFNAWGLAAFESLSSDPFNVTNQGYDWAVGVGLRAGLEWNVAPGWRLGVAGATPAATTKFQSYRGLFADQGSFDAPASITAGVAWDVLPTATLLFDYKHIFYSDIAPVGNSSQIQLPLGSSGGPGFGWHDIDVFTIGAEWRVAPELTLRAGYAHNTQPIRSSDIVFNILAPGVITDSIATGFSYHLSANSAFDVAAIFAPRHDVSGQVPVAFGGGAVDLSMWQVEVTAGWSYRFETGTPTIVAKY
ncbi:MAG TPA: outer membrane protein transport protein [Methylocella sp.]|nr:outer membrane protein transport protein [Methylocella sp.]